MHPVEALKQSVEGKSTEKDGPIPGKKRKIRETLCAVAAGHLLACCDLALATEETQVVADLRKGVAELEPDTEVHIAVRDALHVLARVPDATGSPQ